MSRVKLSVQLESGTAARLEPLREARQLTSWLDAVLAEHIRQLDMAWATLIGAGWTREQLLAACDALNGTWLHDQMGAPSFLALTLSDADRLDRVAAKWDAQDWPAVVARVRDDAGQAEALRLLVIDFWRQGPSEHRLGG